MAAQGLLGDFVRGLRQVSQGRYGEYPVSPGWTLIVQLGDYRIAIGSALAVAVAVAAPSGIRRLALPWLLMLLLGLMYRPIHPFEHKYLAHPLWLIWSINLAIITGGGPDGVETAAPAGAGVGRAAAGDCVARCPAVLRHGRQSPCAGRHRS